MKIDKPSVDVATDQQKLDSGSDKDNNAMNQTSNSVVVAEHGNTEKTKGQSKSKSGKSSPILFLKLAKQFALEGAMLSVEKQMPIEDRAINRDRKLMLRKQQNIETIMQKTLGYCANSDIDSRTDHDWFSRYIALAENVGNATMQDLWAKILAGELYRPGSFSLKALKVFQDMSIHDAKLFAKACSLAVKDNSKKNIRIISGAYQQPGLFNLFDKQRQQHVPLNQFGLNYSDLLALSENHLLYLQESESSVLAKQETLNFIYNGLSLNLSSKKPNSIIQFYKFSPVGVELASLISDRPDSSFLTVLKSQLSHHFNVND